MLMVPSLLPVAVAVAGEAAELAALGAAGKASALPVWARARAGRVKRATIRTRASLLVMDCLNSLKDIREFCSESFLENSKPRRRCDHAMQQTGKGRARNHRLAPTRQHEEPPPHLIFRVLIRHYRNTVASASNGCT